MRSNFQTGKKFRQYEKGLNAILFDAGITNSNMRKEFMKKIMVYLEDAIGDQQAGYMQQTLLDALAITQNRISGYGCKRILSFQEELLKVVEEFDMLATEETVENLVHENLYDGMTDIPLLKYKIDRAVQPLYGDRFLPYDERYRQAVEQAKHRTWDMKRMIETGTCV